MKDENFNSLHFEETWLISVFYLWGKQKWQGCNKPNFPKGEMVQKITRTSKNCIAKLRILPYKMGLG